MDDSFVKAAFSPERAEVYDQQFAALHAVKDLMHLLVRVRFAELPDDARILVAGAGTGQEVRFLAPLFPGWRFTLVDPSEGMLAVAKRHADAEGFADRCAFHTGYVASAPAELHDAATSLLVSHFLTDAEQRRGYFADIAARLKPNAWFFNADLAAERGTESFERAMDHWLRMVDLANRSHDGPVLVTAEAQPEPEGQAPSVPNYREMFGVQFAAHSPAEVEALLSEAGFGAISHCYQALLIHAWCAQRR